MAEGGGDRLRVLSWNLFHGRDHAPGELGRPLARLTRRTVRRGGLAQTNTDLFPQFAELLSGQDWDVALLQEAPPHWSRDLATATGAGAHRVLTARNLPGPLRRLQAWVARHNPDLIASWEGGSNLTLIRPGSGGGRGWEPGAITERRSAQLTRKPERRTMAFTRTGSGLCVANLHASEAASRSATEVERAANLATSWAGGKPLIFGGDLNLRPEAAPDTYRRLARDYGLQGPSLAGSVDQLFSRNLGEALVLERLPDYEREVPDPTAGRSGRPREPIRLSDHRQLVACFRSPETTVSASRGPRV